MTPLTMILSVLSVVVWIMIYVIFFRKNIAAWLDNRFGKDVPPTVPPDAPPEATRPFSFDREHLTENGKNG